MLTETQINEWIEELDPANLCYETLIACTTAKLLDSEPTPAFRKDISRWTKVLTEHRGKNMVLEPEMELLLALEQEGERYERYWLSEIDADMLSDVMLAFNLSSKFLTVCITARLLDSQYTPVFRKHLDRWTKVLTTDGDMIKFFDMGGYNQELRFLIALNQESEG